MARLESKIKLGYYPTPTEVIDRIETILSLMKKKGAGPIRAIDPCVGEGFAFERLCRTLGIEKTFGVELHEGRAQEAKELVGEVIHGDAFRVRAKKGAFSLLFANPPYDQEEGKRLEYNFLRWWTEFLCTDGILVLIIRQRGMVKQMAKFISYWYRDVEVYKFPEKEYEAFGQIVLLGVRKKSAALNSDVQSFLEGVPGKDDLSELDEFSESKYEIPPSAVNATSFYFRNLDLTTEEMVQEVWRGGLLQETIDDLWPEREDVRVKPAFPLRKGHIAILVASGLTDGLLESNGSRMLIKGTIKKHQNKTSEVQDDGTRIEKILDILQITIKALDLNNGEIYTIA